jgi:hypothetical protein
MSYKVTFRDKSEIILPDEAGLALKDHWLGLKRPENIEIGGDGYLSSQIVSIAKTNLAAANMNTPALPQGPIYSCGPYSIQNEIHRRALQHRKQWTKLVRDPRWREKTRLEIRAEDPKRKWCDHHQGEHACLEAKV